MDLDKVLGSSCRRRILRVLWKQGNTNVMDLVRRVNSTYNQVNPNLEALRKDGIISEQRFGRVRMIKLEWENQKTVLLINALKILDTKFTACKPPSGPEQIRQNNHRLRDASSDVDAVSFPIREKNTGQ